MQEKDLTILGSKVGIPQSPEEAILETFDNKHPNNDYVVKLDCLEFTSLCPITGQPDFATFEIVVIPREKLVETKALKLYLGSFRNTGSFQEDLTNRVFNDLWDVMTPKFLRVTARFTSRGGIKISPVVSRVAVDYDESLVHGLLHLSEV